MIVLVNANFNQGDKLFAFIKKFAKHSDSHFSYWDEFAFTVDNRPEANALLVFNNPSESIDIACDQGKILAFMMEPGVYLENPWMFKRLDKYASVYSPIDQSPNTTLSHGYLGWHFQHDWQYLSQLSIPQKTKNISCIASNLKQLKGHRLRTGFVNMLRKKMPQIDFFGRGIHFLPDKLDGLLPYRFSIAIENTSAPYYFTEKINDCFLTYTVPLYYGCKNVGKYFPEKSFIHLDINKPRQAINKIQKVIEDNDWENRLDALKEARDLVLNKYQPLAGAAAIFREMESSGLKQRVQLEPMQPTALQRIKNVLLNRRNNKKYIQL